MKRFVTLVIIVLCYVTVSAQKSVKTQLSNQCPVVLDEIFNDYTIFSIDMVELNELTQRNSSTFQTQISIGSRHSWNMVLEANDLRASSYYAVTVRDEKNEVSANTDIHTYKGYINGNMDNIVRLTIKDDFISGYIKDEQEMWFVEPLSNFTETRSSELVLYNAADVIKTNQAHSCSAIRLDENMGLVENRDPNDQLTGCLELEIATEADYEYYQLHGENSNDVILSILNEVEGVYNQTFEVVFQVTFQRVFSTPNDPYVDSIPSYVLSGFRTHWENNMTDIPRDMAHLFTGKDMDGSAIGIAYVGAVCTTASFAYGVSQNISDFAYSRFVLTAHEIGHNLGGSHVHGTGCGGTGSIMCPGVQPGAFYFSEAAIDAISNKFTTSSECFIGAPKDLLAEINCTDVNLTWSGNSDSGYDVRVRPAGSLNAWINYTTTNNNLQLEQLDGVEYEFQVKQTCSAGESAYSASNLFTPRTSIDIQLKVYLEGAFDSTEAKMSTRLNDLGLLPGQGPTPAGQPYATAPWHYYGTEGFGWTSSDYTAIEAANDGKKVVDWVLTSFRTSIVPEDEVKRAAALLLEDGSIVYPDPNVFPSQNATSMYAIIEHRNHMGIMTPQLISTDNCALIHDFSSQNSYQEGPDIGFGQCQVNAGMWTMHAGDGSQSTDAISYDISGQDKSLWKPENGASYLYINVDFNMDGDVNGNDKTFWSGNNGKSSRVLKSY